MSESGAAIVGRDSELAALREFVEAEPRPQALVLTGGPGMGKTTLWEAGVDRARERGLRVLTARPSGAEVELAFAALGDLLDEIDTKSIPGVPASQLRALEVALARTEPADVPTEAHAVSLGFLNAMRALTDSGPLLVAIDDVLWIEPPSAEVLAFTAARLGDAPVAFLLTRRAPNPSALIDALEPGGPEHLDVGPLSLGAIRRILFERLGLSLPRRVVRRIFESSLGNPLLALELGRTVAERGSLEIGEDIPVSDPAEELLGMRLDGLWAPMQRLLLAVALSPDLRASQLASITDHQAAIDDAIDAGLLRIEGDRVRAAHPLLAAAARKRSRPAERRDLHLALARTATREELRARHLVLAAQRPDAGLAATVARAAQQASTRGAVEEAAELAEHALRLTPEGSAERGERVLALAECLLVAGEEQRVTDLLSMELEELPRGSARARAHLLLADGGGITSVDDVTGQLELAVAESDDDPALRATALARLGESTILARVERIPDAESWALEALPSAQEAGPEVERLVLNALGWVRILRGGAIDDLSERFHAASDSAVQIADSIDRITAVRLAWRGEADEARAILTRLLSLADERGEAFSYVALRLHLCELELRVGRTDAAARLLDEWEQSADRSVLVAPHYERCRALLAAGRGLADDAKRWAAEAIARAEATGVRWDALDASRAWGISALCAGDADEAAESLRPVWEHTEREGVEDPGAFPVAPDLVEALAELGEHDEALQVTRRLKQLATRQEHPWGLATAARCGALVRLASGAYDEKAATALVGVAANYAELGLRFDRARSLLALGRAQRREKQWGAARRSLEEAAAAFEEIGSTGWGERTASELSRVGGRPTRATGELTPAERRTAELAADGLSNKEIAQALFVSVRTVEAHLSSAYGKLGIRTRSQLARRLSAPAQGGAA